MAEAADAPPMMVRLAILEPIMLSELVPGKDVDGTVLQKGDAVLLTQQSNTSENGVWITGGSAQELYMVVCSGSFGGLVYLSALPVGNHGAEAPTAIP